MYRSNENEMQDTISSVNQMLGNSGGICSIYTLAVHGPVYRKSKKKKETE